MLDLVRYEPFGLRTAGGLADWFFGPGLFRHREEEDNFLFPRVDLTEGEKEYTLTAEVPGLKAEDIKVEIEGGRLTLSGEQTEEHKEEKENFYLREYRTGSFVRTLELPGEADPGNIVAKVKDGVLTVSIGKVEDRQPKKIEISVD